MNQWDLQQCSAAGTGFSRAGEDFRGSRLNLHNLLVQHPASTFFMRCGLETGLGGGIHYGDILVVDRALEPVQGSLLVAVLYGELVLRELRKVRGRTWLLPDRRDAAQPLELIPQNEIDIWGVVTYVIHPLQH